MSQIIPIFLALILPLLQDGVSVMAATNECSSPWIQFNQSCYLIGFLKLDWRSSQVICTFHDSILVQVDTSAEDQFLVNQMKKFNTGAIWLGGTDGLSIRTWTWLYGYGPIAYTNWGPPNPSYTDGVEHCIEIRPDGGYRWNDIRCSVFNTFVCEKALSK